MNFHRQLDIFNPDTHGDTPITVIGAGTIGSWLTLALAKEGFRNITVYDDDVIESHNQPNQLYSFSNEGRYKVADLHDIVSILTGISIQTHAEKATPDTMKQLSGIVFFAVDSLDVRRELWNALKFNANAKLLVDGRVGGNVLRVFTVPITNIQRRESYEATLTAIKTGNTEFDALSDAPCTARSIADISFITAGVMSNACRNYLTQKPTQFEFLYDGLNFVKIQG